MAKADMETLQRENEALRQKLAEQESLRAEATSQYSSTIQSEIAKIRQSQTKQQGAAGIVVKEHHDHKNITLWTREGNSVGPMHPANAERFLNDMAAIGVYVSVTRPTAEQTEAYKQTAEYKAKEAAESKRRALKTRSRKSGNMDKLISLMEKQYGVPASQVNNILKPEEVRMTK
jgi:hypothetical protein